MRGCEQTGHYVHHQANFEIWKKIALDESIEYLLYSMDSIGFDFEVGDKTRKTFSDLLKTFSVSQIYNIIWRSSNTSLRFYKEMHVNKKHAANSVITNCRNYGEQAIANKYDLTNYNRVGKCLQSEISEFFFNKILQIGDDGFFCVPRVLNS